MVQRTPPAPAPRLAVISVSYGSEDVLEGFFNSLRDATAASPIVVITDNKPAEGAQVEALANANAANYLPLDYNHGYGFAVNAAVQTLPPDVVWLLISNPDLTFAPGSIDALIRTGDSDSRIGSVGPAIRSTDGQIYPSARAVPSLRMGIGHALFANMWTENPWSRAYKSSQKQTVRRDAGWLSGACILVRRSTYDLLGGFDAGYFMYFEDVDLGYRIGKLGFRNVYEPMAQVTHMGAHSTTEDSNRMIRVHHDSARRFLSKKYSGWLLWPLRAMLSVGLAMRSRIHSRHPRG